MKYLSLFSGVGGFELGIQRAFDNRPTRSQKQTDTLDKASTDTPQGNSRQLATCIGYSEIDKYAIATYERNFGHERDCRLARNGQEDIRLSERQETLDSTGTGLPQAERHNGRTKLGTQAQSDTKCKCKGHTNYGDATKINERELPDFDLLVGGFPCQAFSVAGKRHGFNDTRGTLFFDIARILAHKRPRHLVLENVKGVLSHDSGKTFQTIFGVLTDLGYDVEWQVLNAKDFGVPQNRERIFIVGHLGGECGRQIFPINRTNSATLNYVGAIMSENNKVWLNDGKKHSRNFPQGQRVYAADGISATMASQAGGLGAKTGLYAVPVLTPDRQEKRQNGRRFKTDGEPSFTLNTQDKHGIYDGAKIRRLTPIECERLMSWPDNWTIGSDTQRYKQCGNGVVSNVVQAVIENMKGCLR